MELKKLLATVRDFLKRSKSKTLRQFIGDLSWKFNYQNLAPSACPISKSLVNSLMHAGKRESQLVEALVETADELDWFCSYEPAYFGADIAANLTAVELVGPNGHFKSDEVRLGFFLQGPQVEYPDHWHTAQELYIPLTTGTFWRKDDTEFIERQSGEIIIHESNQRHAMKTEAAPLLALWIWRGGDLQQKPDF